MAKPKRRFKIVIEVEPHRKSTQREIIELIKYNGNLGMRGHALVSVKPYRQSPLLFKAARLLREIADWGRGKISGEIIRRAYRLSAKILGHSDG